MTSAAAARTDSAALLANLACLEPLLRRLRADGLQHVINGALEPASDGEIFADHSPVDGSLICEVARGTVDDVDRAARAAQRAFPGWRDVPAARRQRLLHAIADGIERRAEDIALLESWDAGQPIRFMAKAALRGAENFRFFADRAASARDGLALPTDTHLNYTGRTPIGPVGVITPWNTPFMLSTWKIAPALAAGCTVVHKPAEWSPVTAQLLAEIALEAGLPPGVLNVVHGLGEQAGRALTEHAAIRAIASSSSPTITTVEPPEFSGVSKPSAMAAHVSVGRTSRRSAESAAPISASSDAVNWRSSSSQARADGDVDPPE